MKRRMIRAIILFIITFLALLVFIGLYIDETRRVQETYRTQFNANLAQTSESIQSYLDNDADLDMRYRRIISDMSSADTFVFLLDNVTEAQKITVNELQSALLRYPEQMQERERMEALLDAVNDLQSNLDKGFDEAAAIVDSLDLKGH